MSAVHLDEASVEAVANRVAELLRGENVAGELVDATEIARRFGVSRDWVYDHADELGAVKLGDGPKARMRFDPAIVAGRLDAPKERPSPRRGTRRRNQTPEVALLQIKGRDSDG